MQVQYATLTTFPTHYTRYTLYTVYYLLCIALSGPRRAGPTGAGLGACMGLSTLSLCRNAVGDRGAEAIAAGMRSHSAGLFYLSIYSIYLSCPIAFCWSILSIYLFYLSIVSFLTQSFLCSLSSI
jgi:hypothetical protein